MIYFLMFSLAFWAGFSVRRASLCLVRATHEIVHRKPAKTMFFIMHAMVVALSITIPAMVVFPDFILLAPSYGLSTFLIMGACLYGVGSSINGSCALGTLNQLMSGKIEFLASIIGIAIGFFGFLTIQDWISLDKLQSAKMINGKIIFFVPLILLVWSITIFQTYKFFKTHQGNKLRKLKQYITSSVARDYVGISIFGFCSGALYLILGGSWDYTSLIQSVETSIYTSRVFNLPILVTTIALIFGMGAASILSKDFQYQKPEFLSFVSKLIAGSMMGVAVGLIPGGNDTLILHGIPGLAIHAPIALVVMMASIAAIMWISKTFSNSKA